jgi:signal transduction histidine kinase
MQISQFNTIAVRIAITIVLAIVLGITLVIAVTAGLANFDFRTGHGRDAGAAHVIVSRSSVLVIDPRRRNALMLSGTIATVVRILASVPAAERQAVVDAMADPMMHIALRDAPPPPPGRDHGDSRLDALGELIQLQLGGLSPSLHVATHLLPTDVLSARDRARVDPGSVGVTPEIGTEVDITSPDGWSVSFIIPNFPMETASMLWRLGPLFVVIALLSVWTARRLAAPIRDFAGAAERFGVDMAAPPLTVRGPHELRMAIRAFNLMQERLQRFLEDRTQMLAAISHDLRAPLARLRLRAEFVEDEEQQRKMFGDLDAMNAMIGTTLAFARDAARQEPRTLVDLGSLVGDVCEDVADAGGAVSYLGPRGIEVTCRPSVINRAIANLIDNAVKYGGSAQVRIVREPKQVVIVIDDDGPGIPEAEQEKVFAPFYRLDPARDPAKAGIGLGLCVARTIAREHGGDVTLTNRDGGGLSVRIELPAEAMPQQDRQPTSA